MSLVKNVDLAKQDWRIAPETREQTSHFIPYWIVKQSIRLEELIEKAFVEEGRCNPGHASFTTC